RPCRDQWLKSRNVSCLSCQALWFTTPASWGAGFGIKAHPLKSTSNPSINNVFFMAKIVPSFPAKFCYPGICLLPCPRFPERLSAGPAAREPHPDGPRFPAPAGPCKPAPGAFGRSQGSPVCIPPTPDCRVLREPRVQESAICECNVRLEHSRG